MTITIRPQPANWRGLLAARADARGGATGQAPGAISAAEIARFREQLGLNAEQPIIMSGHQAEFWHCGILAKYLATGAAARRLGAQGAWLWVDQDANAFGQVRCPVRASGGGGRGGGGDTTGEEDGSKIGVETLALAAVGEGTPVACANVMTPAAGPAEALASRAPLESVKAGMRAIIAGLAEHRGQANAARQIAAAIRDLVSALAGAEAQLKDVFATELARTELFGRLVAMMASDPARCVSAYNAAAAKHPHAGIKPLAVDGRGGFELPLWRLSSAGRAAVTSGNLAADGTLAPRALLMTGLVRLAGCELFVHGMGGAGRDGAAGYDRVTDAWFAGWLGTQAKLAPVALVTATMTLPLRASDAVAPEDVAAAQRLARRAGHEPAMLGDAAAEGARQTALAVLQRPRARRGAGRHEGRAERAAAFAELHRGLARYREAHAERLAGLAAHTTSLRQRLAAAGLANDRTWSFAFFEPAELVRLRDAIAGMF